MSDDARSKKELYMKFGLNIEIWMNTFLELCAHNAVAAKAVG